MRNIIIPLCIKPFPASLSMKILRNSSIVLRWHLLLSVTTYDINTFYHPTHIAISFLVCVFFSCSRSMRLYPHTPFTGLTLWIWYSINHTAFSFIPPPTNTVIKWNQRHTRDECIDKIFTSYARVSCKRRNNFELNHFPKYINVKEMIGRVVNMSIP